MLYAAKPCEKCRFWLDIDKYIEPKSKFLNTLYTPKFKNYTKDSTISHRRSFKAVCPANSPIKK
jgi:hypothetical protein